MTSFNYLESRYYSDIRSLMLTPGLAEGEPTSLLESQADYSFAGQAHLLDDADAVILTAYSAVPVADAVRGYFEERGQKPPYLGHVHSNFTPSNGFHSLSVFENYSSQVERLRKELGDTASAVVIDQLTCSGTALMIGKQTLEQAGVKSIRLMPGRWYIQGYRTEIKLESVTSVHSEFMRDIGRSAARYVKVSSLERSYKS